MEVEPGTVEDAETVADLWVSLAAEQVQYGSHVFPERSRPSIREAASRHAATGSLLVVRADDADGSDGSAEAVLGFVMFDVQGSEPTSPEVRGVIENLYVVPERRGRGLGSALLRAAEDRLEDRGVERVTLEAMAANEAARRFYRRHGYDVYRVEFEKPTGETVSAGEESTESDSLSKEGG